MGTSLTLSGLPDSQALDYQQVGPTVLRILVGSQLRRLREASGISPKDAGEAIRASHSKISRLETGRTGFKIRDVTDLLNLYEVHDEAERAALLALARQANVPGWWHTYGDLVPNWFEPYLGLEQGASVIRSYEVQFIPGLLQTEDYARAVIQLGHSDAKEAEIERRVHMRMERQRLLTRPDPPRVWVVIDEAAFRRPVGGAATMRGQIRHLLDIAALPHLTIEMVPFSAGGHAAAGGPITILRFAQDAIPDMVYLEHLTHAFYSDRQSDIDLYCQVMHRLVIHSQPLSSRVATLPW